MKIPCEICNLKNSCKYREKILAIISRESGIDALGDCNKILEFAIIIRRKMLLGASPPAIIIGRVVFVAPEFIIYI